MSRRKLAKFAANKLRENVIEPSKPIYENIKGKWNQDIFGKEAPLTLELASYSTISESDSS